MESFEFFNPTKIYFGEGAICNLEQEMNKCGKKILLLYGGGSIKKNGIYDNVIKILNKTNKQVVELGGVTPNPRTDITYKGIQICKEQCVDFILAVGGGSTLDCAKAIALGAKTDKDFWQTHYIDKQPANDALPLGSVMTLAGTGSEMNGGSVISNMQDTIKADFSSDCMRPKFSILDPTYTYSLPLIQLKSGCVDILSHVFEVYFSKPDYSNLSDDICEAIIKNVIYNLKIAIQNPRDTIARANIMWDATMALNGITKLGKQEDWQTHQLEHQVSAYYDITHGLGLGIITPSYFRYVCKDGLDKFVKFATSVWEVDANGKSKDQIANEGIDLFEKFLVDIDMPTKLSQVGIDKSHLDDIANTTNITGGGYKKLSHQDLRNILEMAY